MGQQVKLTHKLGSLREEDYAYYPYEKGSWVILRVLPDQPRYFNPKCVVRCEIIAACERDEDVVGKTDDIKQDVRVRKLSMMEVVAWAAR